MMLWDIYALAKHRNEQVLKLFVDRFLPDNTIGVEEHEYRLSTEAGTLEFARFTDFIRHACSDREAHGSLTVRSSDPRTNGSLHFLADGALVLGLTVSADGAMNVLADLVSTVGCGWGYVAGDAEPPKSESAFLDQCDITSREISIAPDVHYVKRQGSSALGAGRKRPRQVRQAKRELTHAIRTNFTREKLMRAVEKLRRAQISFLKSRSATDPEIERWKSLSADDILALFDISE